MPMFTSLAFAGALGLINLWLAYRCVRVRLTGPGGVGDLGIPLLQARMRAHANFTEYSSIVLILTALLEYSGVSRINLQVLCMVYLLGRVVHAFGIERPRFASQFVGALATWAVLLVLSVWATILAVQHVRIR